MSSTCTVGLHVIITALHRVDQVVLRRAIMSVLQAVFLRPLVSENVASHALQRVITLIVSHLVVLTLVNQTAQLLVRLMLVLSLVQQDVRTAAIALTVRILVVMAV